jgi:hypothetical protein
VDGRCKVSIFFCYTFYPEMRPGSA